MITVEDIDRCIVESFKNDLKHYTLEEAAKELARIEDIIDSETEWAEALSAYLRLSRSQG